MNSITHFVKKVPFYLLNSKIFSNTKQHLMKKYGLIQAILMTITMLFFSYCSNSSKKGDYLPELKIAVPEILKDNTEAVLFIQNSQKTLNQWSVTFEDLAIACKPYADKTEEELSAVEKLRLGKIMLEFMSGMGKFAVEIAEIEQTLTTIEDGMTESESEALKKIMASFEKRINEIGKKYENFGDEDADNTSFN